MGFCPGMGQEEEAGTCLGLTLCPLHFSSVFLLANPPDFYKMAMWLNVVTIPPESDLGL